MQKILFLFALIALNGVASETITSKDVKIAVGKIILNQEKTEFRQNEFEEQIALLQHDISDLKKAQYELNEELLKNISKNIVHINTFAKEIDRDNNYKSEEVTTKAYFTNVRERPNSNSNSRIIATLPICSNIKIDDCFLNKESQIWCRLESQGYVRENLLSFNKVKVRVNPTLAEIVPNSIIYETNLNNTSVEVLAISMDRTITCLSGGKQIPSKILAQETKND